MVATSGKTGTIMSMAGIASKAERCAEVFVVSTREALRCSRCVAITALAGRRIVPIGLSRIEVAHTVTVAVNDTGTINGVVNARRSRSCNTGEHRIDTTVDVDATDRRCKQAGTVSGGRAVTDAASITGIERISMRNVGRREVVRTRTGADIVADVTGRCANRASATSPRANSHCLRRLDILGRAVDTTVRVAVNRGAVTDARSVVV